MGGRGPLGAVTGRYPSSDGTTQLGGILKHNRKCRDVGFLVVFLAFWVAMIVNSSFGFNKGNPLRLTYGLDYKGNLCGYRHADPNLGELELRYWLNPNQVYQSGLKDSQFKLSDARSICLLDCPVPSEDSLNWVCDYPEGDIRISMQDWIDRNYDYFEFLTPEMRNSSLQLQGPCYPVIFPSVNVYWSCQLIARASNMSLRHWQQMGGVQISDNILIDRSIHKAINARSSVLKRYMADVGKAWPVLIVCGGLLPLSLSVIWLLLIRHFVAAMPWITVGLFNILITSVTMFYYLKAGWIGNDGISPMTGEQDPYYHATGRELHHIQAIAVLTTFVMTLSVLTSIAIVRRILMATSVLKASVAAKVIGEVQALIIFPIAPYAFLAVFYMLWFSAALHLLSSGRVVQNNCNSNCCAYNLALKKVNCDRCCGYSIRYTPHIAIAVLFHLFGGYWATQFIIACSATVIAGSVASYYWARGGTSPKVPFLPVFSSMKRLIRYSLGSIALGSLVVSFVESVRFMLESFRRKLKGAGSTPDAWIGKATFHSSRFSLKCIEWTIKSINRNAYIMVASTGKSFFRSSEMATGVDLQQHNADRQSQRDRGHRSFSGEVLREPCQCIVLLPNVGHAQVCWLLGYVVATLLFGVVEMSIDTIILSFCQDTQEYQGTAQHAPPLLMETLNDDHNEMQGD
ncbi:hypothetical protein MLD38_034188 [Melastoma candidum]|uniref:Uncharacterized protein n=1 Tax=Melastoma candidum TaxID=119954 RepID=A0ACB9M8Y0_9MYRT|nr:hypothetical protein MLD38_034188 [Melastoma candidum]